MKFPDYLQLQIEIRIFHLSSTVMKLYRAKLNSDFGSRISCITGTPIGVKFQSFQDQI